MGIILPVSYTCILRPNWKKKPDSLWSPQITTNSSMLLVVYRSQFWAHWAKSGVLNSCPVGQIQPLALCQLTYRAPYRFVGNPAGHGLGHWIRHAGLGRGNTRTLESSPSTWGLIQPMDWPCSSHLAYGTKRWSTTHLTEWPFKTASNKSLPSQRCRLTQSRSSYLGVYTL